VVFGTDQIKESWGRDVRLVLVVMYVYVGMHVCIYVSTKESDG